eukprot:scaffold20544_cov158-Amphora_coffeaeformis.AAC.2
MGGLIFLIKWLDWAPTDATDRTAQLLLLRRSEEDAFKQDRAKLLFIMDVVVVSSKNLVVGYCSLGALKTSGFCIVGRNNEGAFNNTSSSKQPSLSLLADKTRTAQYGFTLFCYYVRTVLFATFALRTSRAILRTF